MQMTTATIILLATLLAGCNNSTSGPVDTAESCPDLGNLVLAGIPGEVGNEELAKRLLSPQPGLLETDMVFNPERVSKIFNDPVEEQVKPCEGDVARNHDEARMFCNTEGTRLRMDAGRGRMTYLNPARSFSFADSEENKLEKAQAIDISHELLASLGVPTEEFGKQAEARVLIAAGRDHENRKDVDKRRAELHVLISRQVSDFPVFDSMAKLAIDARGDVARAHLVWPKFELMEGLSMGEQYSRDAVVRMIEEKLKPEEGCNRYASLRSFVAYADSSEVSFGEGQDEHEEQQQSSVRYIPSLVVYALPPEPKEDSGEIAMAGLQFTLPLFSSETSGDSGKGG